MADFSNIFKSLPSEFQKVLSLAEDTLKIEVTPLQELSGGRTGAFLFLVSISSPQSNSIRHLILKLDHKSKTTKYDELERHSTAIKQAPPEFAHAHIADLVFDRVQLDEAVAIFYSIAGQSLHHYKSLASYQQQNELERIFSTVNNILLAKWNVNPEFEKAVHPQKILAHWLGYRLNIGSDIENFLENICHINQNTAGLMIQGHVFPNPLVYSRNYELWNEARPIDTIVGFQHGDLNIGNILTKFGEDNKDLTGIFIIDFALFKSGMPLLYDQRYLEISYLIRELSRVSLPKLVDMIYLFAEQDIVDPLQVPVELAGACAVINAGRKAFNNWVQEFYPSLSDDLWGQFWLAAVAAGLNYCNKISILEKERLAGLVYASAHLKHYHSVFGVPLPIEVKHLDIISQPENSSKTGSGKMLQRVSRNNLPSQTTLFIGRQKEVTEVSQLLDRDDIRLITLTGPGGTGKTRLALRIAANLIDSFDDGVSFVDLSSVTEPESVIVAIARTVGFRETSDRSLLENLKINLKAKKLLLIMDNFEQVTAASPRIGELLRDCPQLKLLITSREALHIRGEHVFPVPPLTLPGIDLKQQSFEQFAASEAVQLFIESASCVKPNFELTNENARTVAEICSRLDGLPLAIGLAAARINMFSPDALLERLGSRLKFLRGGAHDLPVRQQTLRDAIDWSYDLLDKGEQRLFALLSVFIGCTFEEVEVVSSGIKQLEETRLNIFDGLTSLLDKNLIRRIDQNNGEPRFLMLETIREYAKEHLEKESEFNVAAFRTYAAFFADFAKLQWKRLAGDERETALKEIEPDIENLRISWNYWVKEGNLEQLNKLSDCLWLLYDARGWYYASVDLTSDLLKVLASTPSTPELAQQEIILQTSLARVLMAIKGPTVEVEKAYTRALELCQKHGEIPKSFPVLRALAGFYTYIGDFRKSAEFGEQILNLSEQFNDVNIQVEGHLVFGYSLIFSGSIAKGLEHLEKGIAMYNPDLHGSPGFRFGINPVVTSYTTFAIFSWILGSPDRALKFADDAIALARKLNHPFSIAYSLFHTALLHLWMQNSEIVLGLAQSLLEIAEKHEFQIWKAAAICLHGAALVGMGHVDEGLIELNQGIDMYKELITPPVFWPMLLSIRAVTFVRAGRPEEGLILIDEALKIIGQSTDNPLLTDFYRLKGDVHLMISQDNMNLAESLFRQALDLARKHKTAMFEVKASIRLFKLLQKQDKTEEGKQLLYSAYQKFNEGFTTVDLIEAKNLIADVT